MYIADLHIHSRFARACSQQLNLANLAQWAKFKGLQLLGTGDFLHPVWLSELKANLKEDDRGFLSYPGSQVKFALTVEVSSIYSHNGKVRRVHNLIMMPSFASAQKLQQALLSKKATLSSDGRPIVGIPSKELLRMSLEADEKAIFIPAHIWTPWFGVFGSESGYDSLADCFEELAPYVFAIETGLSSDPAMNWRVGELDRCAILSFSDAHSLPNLGREATVFSGNLNNGWEGFYHDLKKQQLAGTIEFYPEEGKYHFTGHRICQVKYSPDQTKARGEICPVCGRGLTIGVMERVENLAERSVDELKLVQEDSMVRSIQLSRPGYKMLVPLMQIIAEVFDVSPGSLKVLNEYRKLVTSLGGEIRVLTKASLEEIKAISNPLIAEGVDRNRKGELVIEPGYDGVYGVVKIWPEESSQPVPTPQLGLFD